MTTMEAVCSLLFQNVTVVEHMRTYTENFFIEQTHVCMGQSGVCVCNMKHTNSTCEGHEHDLRNSVIPYYEPMSS